jgi:hypothetical protein
MTLDHGPRGDDDLGRLIAEGLARRVEGPVDERSLVAGAQAGARRIRRRRSVATALAAVVVLGLPVGIYGARMVAGPERSTATAVSDGRADAGSMSAAEAGSTGAQDVPTETGSVAMAPGSAGGDAGSGPGLAAQGSALAAAPDAAAAGSNASQLQPSIAGPLPESAAPAAPATGAPTAAPRAASGVVAVPAAALLVAADLRPVTATTVVPSGTSAPAAAPVLTAADLCGRAPTGVPPSAGSLGVTFEDARGAPDGWLLGSAVRAFGGSGAVRYLATLTAAGACLAPTLGSGADAAAVGHGPPDGLGRTHWLAVAVTGRTVAEVRLVAPKGSGVSAGSVAALLSTAVRRLRGSGLPAAAAADPRLA